MNIHDWLASAQATLTKSHISSARLDCLVMLQDLLHKDKSWILAHPEHDLTPEKLEDLNKKVSRRATHEPLAYIRGTSEFYGRNFEVNHHTLVPRPETETMLDLLKNFLSKQAEDTYQVIDVGTGSGCIAITAKLEFPSSTVLATDIDPHCIAISQSNARLLDVNLEFYQTNLVANLPEKVYEQPAIILANLPYVPDQHAINEAARHEPTHAIFGGPDGLDLFRSLFGQLHDFKHIVRVYTESLATQHAQLDSVATEFGLALVESQDLIRVYAPEQD